MKNFFRFFSILFFTILLLSCSSQQPSTVTPPQSTTTFIDIVPSSTPSKVPTATPFFSPTQTAFPSPTNTPVIDFGFSLEDIKETAQIAANDHQSIEYQSMKYVLNSGLGQTIFYDGIPITPYEGILDYLNKNQLNLTGNNIPILEIPSLERGNYEQWKSGRWYFAHSRTGLSLDRAYETMIFTNIDNDEGTILHINAFLDERIYQKGFAAKFYNYSAYICVYQDQECYMASLLFDEKFKFVASTKVTTPPLDAETMDTWIRRLETEILPDLNNTFMKE